MFFVRYGPYLVWADEQKGSSRWGAASDDGSLGYGRYCRQGFWQARLEIMHLKQAFNEQCQQMKNAFQVMIKQSCSVDFGSFYVLKFPN